MPYIKANLTIKMEEQQKNELQIKLTDAVSKAFSKPKTYIMTEIEDNKSLYMADKKLEKGAYIAISMLGTATKQVCKEATSEICNVLESSLNIDGSNVYITYHPVELWGWNGNMF